MRLKIKEQFLKNGLAHVLLASFLMGITAAFFLGVSQSLKQAADAVRPHLQVSVYLLPTTSDAEAAQLGATLKSRDSQIVSATFVSKAAAYQEALKDPTLAKSLSLLPENPLPAVYLLQYSEQAWMNRSEPAEPLRGLPQIQEIRWDAQSRSIFRTLYETRQWLNRLCLASCIALGVWAIFGFSRLLILKLSFRRLSPALLVGAIGGSCAAALWWVTTRALAGETLLFHLQPVSPWPILAGVMVGLALVNENSTNEN